MNILTAKGHTPDTPPTSSNVHRRISDDATHMIGYTNTKYEKICSWEASMHSRRVAGSFAIGKPSS